MFVEFMGGFRKSHKHRQEISLTPLEKKKNHSACKKYKNIATIIKDHMTMIFLVRAVGSTGAYMINRPSLENSPGIKMAAA